MGRAEHMEAKFRAGDTLESIAVSFGITRQRVWQILTKRGIGGEDGGRTARARTKQEAVIAARRVRVARQFGCDLALYDEVRRIGLEMARQGRAYKQTPLGAYCQQRNTAADRGIAWELNFEQWWRLWSDSGKWADRGRGVGKYVMCRRGDVGPYSAANAFIALATYNTSGGIQDGKSSLTGTGEALYMYSVVI